jgi:hypothetical protein
MLKGRISCAFWLTESGSFRPISRAHFTSSSRLRIECSKKISGTPIFAISAKPDVM